MSSVGSIRLSGLASGLDVDQLVTDLMKNERLPLDKLVRKKQSTVWKREAYQTANTALSAFQTQMRSLRLESSFVTKKAVSSATNVAEVSSTSSVSSNTNFNLNVTKLATSASLVTGKITTDPTTALTVDGSFTITGSKGTETITVTGGTSTIDSIVKGINNVAGKTGVQASFDKSSGRLMLTSTDLGSNARVTVGDSGGAFQSIFNPLSLNAEGKDAVYTVNDGVEITASSNNINVGGLNVILRSTGTTSISVASDNSGVADKIKAFVSKYNELVDSFSSVTAERPDRDYTPLTDAEKEAMTESQIEKWESKAKQGVLYNDSVLRSTLTTFRNYIMEDVKGLPSDMNSLADIGITPVKNYKENGKLEIDEAKLNAAINSDIDRVMAIFTKSSTTEADTAENKATRRKEQGIADRFYEELDVQMKNITKVIGSGKSSEAVDDSVIGRQLKTINEQQSAWASRLEDIQARYYKRFTAMEVAMQKLNSQGNWLSQQLGSM